MKNKIRQWFEQHDISRDDINDGDYYIADRSYPFDVIPPRADSDAVLYCTKQHCLNRLLISLDGPSVFGAVARGGLPSVEDAEWLRSIVGARRLLFWGDADPADLLHYSWLREQLPIEHVGMSDRLLSDCKVTVNDSYTIELGPSELAALPLITECLGDLTKLLGPACAGLLEQPVAKSKWKCC